MDQLLKTLIEFQLRIKPKNCQPSSKCLDVLGHCWEIDRFKVPKAKLQGIIEWDTPKTHDEVASYTGHLGYYRRYTPGLAECLLPLQELATIGIEYKKKGKLQRQLKKRSRYLSLFGNKDMRKVSKIQKRPSVRRYDLVDFPINQQ